MDNIFLYFIKTSICIAVLYGFYRIFLSHNTFHRINRYFLLLIFPLSLICPSLHIANSLNPYFMHSNFIAESFSDFAGNITGSKTPDVQSGISPLNFVIIFVYFTGVIFFLGRFIAMTFKLFREVKMSVADNYEGYTILRTNHYNSPFSFFKWIFIPEGFDGLEGYSLILEHEKVHVHQRHSLDLLVMELLSVAFWYNPFVFLIKRSLKSLHEFSADHEVIKNISTVPEYLSLLVSGTEISCLTGITHHFKSLIIKKRITMISKIKTPSYRKYLYLLTLPLVALMIQAISPGSTNNNPPSIRPVKDGEITSAFGVERKTPFVKEKTRHTGVDIKAPIGTDIISPAAGVVLEADQDKDWGFKILIKHDEHFQTFYAHMEDVTVKKGDQVRKGQIIGHVGSTGLSTGPHLHYEVIKDGQRVNPEDYFNIRNN